MRAKTKSLSEYFRPPRGTYRSANLLLDFGEPQVLQSYLPTRKSIAVLHAIFDGFNDGGVDRAVSLIAPYGSGKSSLLLVLGALLAKPPATQVALRNVLDRLEELAPSTATTIRKQVHGRRRYLIVLLSGYEGALPIAFVAGLKSACHRQDAPDLWRQLSARFPELRRPTTRTPSAGSVLSLYQAAAKEVSRAGFLGLVVLYDEFGKVFEVQQAEPQPQDLLFIQNFAELCSRSGPAQLQLVVALHQGFAQYAHRLPLYLRNEWAKIEGRFRPISFIEDSLQVYELIAQTLNRLHSPEMKTLAARIRSLANQYAEEAGRVPGLAEIEPKAERVQLFQAAYPLHPLSLYVLPRLSARVAQNERTLFHFLLGQEPSCLYSLLQKHQLRDGSLPLLGVTDLFEYFADLMIKDTGVGGTYRRFIEIRTALDRLKPEETLARDLIKTIGILSVIGEATKIPPTEDVLHYALGAFSPQVKEELNGALMALVERRILLYRRHNREYRIWEGSDIDTLSLMRQKKAELEKTFNIVRYLGAKVPPPPILAHRYNEDYGITRYFEGELLALSDLPRLSSGWEQTLGGPRQVDGTAYYILAVTPREIEEALELTKAIEASQVVFGIPRKPLALADPLLELYCLEHLLGDPTFIGQDPVIQRELSELADDCLSMVRRGVSHLLDPRYGETYWVYRGQIQHGIDSQVKLRRLVSDICQAVFPATPRFNNELINRRQPSAVIVNARKKLVRAILENTGRPNLALTGFGPDVSMFRAVLLAPGLYQEVEPGRYRFVTSEAISRPNVRQMLKAIEEFLAESAATPRSFRPLLERLQAPPFGIRPGVIPILLAAAYKASTMPLNLMDEGVYVKELKPELFEKILQLPDKVTVQCLPVAGEVQEYLDALTRLFPRSWDPSRDESADPIRRALETMYRWLHGLPACALKTQRLSERTNVLRTLLTQATDPVALITYELPKLFREQGASPEAGSGWLDRLRESVEELSRVKGSFIQEVGRLIREVFGLPAGTPLVDGLNTWANARSPDLHQYLEDPQCEGFLTRVQKRYSSDDALIESMASLVTGRSIAHWDDSFLRQFELVLLQVHRKLTETDELLRRRLASGERVVPSWEVHLTPPGESPVRLLIPAVPLSPAAQALRDNFLTALKTAGPLTDDELRRVVLELMRETGGTAHGA